AISHLTNYPNPFNPSTTIQFETTNLHEFAQIKIYNIKGQKVKQLVSDQLSAGQHSIVWDGTDDNNKPVGSGIYFYKLKAGKINKTRKMLLIK
ncbi:MAG TPA: T9SS type A sorting domain-containing protein, partial [Candidatus Cloacimonadota bacterium]|nr:T9SS type A sorting domain-containing protein [Candidatus Cloacimonadota bacterium]